MVIRGHKVSSRQVYPTKWDYLKEQKTEHRNLLLDFFSFFASNHYCIVGFIEMERRLNEWSACWVWRPTLESLEPTQSWAQHHVSLIPGPLEWGKRWRQKNPRKLGLTCLTWTVVKNKETVSHTTWKVRATDWGGLWPLAVCSVVHTYADLPQCLHAHTLSTKRHHTHISTK